MAAVEETATAVVEETGTAAAEQTGMAAVEQTIKVAVEQTVTAASATSRDGLRSASRICMYSYRPVAFGAGCAPAAAARCAVDVNGRGKWGLSAWAWVFHTCSSYLYLVSNTLYVVTTIEYVDSHACTPRRAAVTFD